MSSSIAVVAAVVVTFSLVSKRIGPTVISAPMLFVAAGLVLGPEVLGVVDLGLEITTVELVGEVALAVLLFSDASRIDLPELRREYRLPLRLLGIGLPLTTLLGTGILLLLVDGVDVWHAALISAILSPTDAALGQEVVTDEAVPLRIRQGLIVESGLNDGLVVPAVALFLALSTTAEDTGGIGFWARFLGEQLGVGVAVGLLVGGLGAAAMNLASRHDWVDGLHAQLATISLTIGTLALALALDGNGFIAAFVAGLAFGRIADDPEYRGEFTEDVAHLAAMVSFFLFGNILLGPAISLVSAGIVACAIAALTVMRIAPVAVALIGSGAAWETQLFVGWFGPRGLASILFGILLLEEEINGGDDLFAVVAWTVALSVILHGATAAWGARRYGRWWDSMDQVEQASMIEGT